MAALTPLISTISCAPPPAPPGSSSANGFFLGSNGALLPEDAYENGTYWADLPSGERSAWINAQSNAECLRELKVVGSMAKADPLSPFSHYMKRYAANGMVSSVPFLDCETSRR